MEEGLLEELHMVVAKVQPLVVVPKEELQLHWLVVARGEQLHYQKVVAKEHPVVEQQRPYLLHSLQLQP